MTTPIDDLSTLASALEDLNQVQSWIDNARLAAPTNQVVQAKLDQHQADVDYKRARIKIAMNSIYNRL